MVEKIKDMNINDENEVKNKTTPKFHRGMLTPHKIKYIMNIILTDKIEE